MDQKLFIPRLTVIGVGLLGGSLVQALRRVDAIGEVIGVGRQVANLQTAVELGVIDRYTHDPLQGVVAADMVVLATPVSSMRSLLQTIKPAIHPGMTITDVGSVKGGVVEAAEQVLQQQFAQFVPAHPIAGTEKSGVGAAFPELFEQHRVILTPLAQTDQHRLDLVRLMWLACGAEVLQMDVAEHDRILSITSHLPHVLAFTLMEFLASSKDPRQCYQLAAGGFHDFTRIASGDPAMWCDISLMNGVEICAQIDRFRAVLKQYSELIKSGNADRLEQLIREAGVIRAEVVRHKGNVDYKSLRRKDHIE